MKKSEKFNKFSVPLGLLDYGNPIFYTITMVTIIRNLYYYIGNPFNNILFLGAIISIIGGFIIPTGKVLVGMGIMKFKMPVGLVFFVNFGILLSGLTLLKYVLSISLINLLLILLIIIFVLVILYQKSNKFNTIAVLTGAFGYIMIYNSLIILSIRNSILLPIILYVVAICLFIFLCGIGIKADLKNPKTHWILEASNVICQMLVMIGTIVLFLN